MIERAKLALPALTGLATVAALIMSGIALVNSSESNGMTAVRTAGAPPSAQLGVAPEAPPHVVDVTIRPASKLGPDGKMHDAYSERDFAVRVRQPLTLRISNTDNQPHSITSTRSGVDIIAMPGTHSYTVLVKRAGRFTWRCLVMCDTGADGWAMTHAGYMSGFIPAT